MKRLSILVASAALVLAIVDTASLAHAPGWGATRSHTLNAHIRDRSGGRVTCVPPRGFWRDLLPTTQTWVEGTNRYWNHFVCLQTTSRVRVLVWHATGRCGDCFTVTHVRDVTSWSPEEVARYVLGKRP